MISFCHLLVQALARDNAGFSGETSFYLLPLRHTQKWLFRDNFFVCFLFGNLDIYQKNEHNNDYSTQEEPVFIIVPPCTYAQVASI